MGLPELARLAVIVFYSLGTAFFLAGVLSRREKVKATAHLVTGAGFLAHTLLLVVLLQTQGFPPESKAYYVQFLSWVLLLVYFVIWWRHRLEFLALTATPLALLLFLTSLKLGSAQTPMPPSLKTLFFGLHIGAIFLSLGLLVMAFGAGLLFLHLDRKIKAKERLTGFRKDLPALSTFDKVNHWAVVAGFPLFTMGVFSGFVWARIAWGKMITWDPKEVVSVAIWLVFAVLFHQRIALGWRGRKPALLAVLVFVFSVVSMVGINLFVPTHHSLVAPTP